MLLYIEAPMFLDATFTSKVHLKPCGVGLSQASFLKNLISIGSETVSPGGWFMAFNIASLIPASEGSDPPPPQPTSPSVNMIPNAKVLRPIRIPLPRENQTILAGQCSAFGFLTQSQFI